MGPNPNGPLRKLLELLDTQVFSGSVQWVLLEISWNVCWFPKPSAPGKNVVQQLSLPTFLPQKSEEENHFLFGKFKRYCEKEENPAPVEIYKTL